MQNQKKKQNEQKAAEELLLEMQITGLLEDQDFTTTTTSTLLDMLEHHHHNLHESDYRHMFKLLQFLNSLEYVQKSRLLVAVSVVMFNASQALVDFPLS